jgi:hypothetical protein
MGSSLQNALAKASIVRTALPSRPMPQHGKVTRLAFAPGARLRSGTKRAAGRKTATRRKVARKTPNPARLTARQRVVLNRIVARAKRAITKDVRDGVVPRSVRTIGGLGDYVDQNMYFLDAAGDLDPEVEAMQIDLGRDGVDQQPMWDFLTLAMDRVESWMKAGGLTRISAARKVSARKRMSRRTPNPSAPSRMSFFEVYDAGGGGFEIVRAQSAQSVERKYRGASARRLRDSEIGEGDLNYFGPNGTRVTEAMRDEHRRATARPGHRPTTRPQLGSKRNSSGFTACT